MTDHRLLWAALLMIAAIAAASNAASPEAPGCDRAASWADERICAASALAALREEVATRVAALRDEVRAEALRVRLAEDQHEWLETLDGCRAAGDAPEDACLESALLRRLAQLVFYRYAFIGPELPQAPFLGCSLAATTQIEMRACTSERLRYAGRALDLAAAAAPAELAELDRITSAAVGAERAFERAQQTFESYREADCAAVAASYAGGSGAGLAELECRLEASWRRANEIASRYLLRQAHWSEALEDVAGAISVCLEAAPPGGDPRITGVREAGAGGRALRIAIGDAARIECVVSGDLEVERIAEVDGADVWPSEGLAIFYPLGSRLGAEKLEAPAADECTAYRWLSTRAGDLAGWLALSNCW